MSNLDALRPYLPEDLEKPNQGAFGSEALFSLDPIYEGARNETIFKEASSLQARGFDDEEIRRAAFEANETRCYPPLPDEEVRSIVENVLSRYPKGDNRDLGGRPASTDMASRFRPRGSKLSFHTLAKELIGANSACFIGGAPAIWNGQRFVFGWDEINRAANRLEDAITNSELREVQGYLNRNAPRLEPADSKYIAFGNGVVDIETGDLLNATNVLYMPNVVPHDYDPEAYDETADAFLWDVSCDDQATRRNLEEIIGACFYRGKINGQCPVCIGDGSNGKSTFLNALVNALGPENVSSLDIADVGKQFHVGCLAGKLANIGDDISNSRLKGDCLSVFKKAATGDRLHADVKLGAPYDFVPYATLLFSCNDFPSLGDISNGMMRRLFPIPFDAHFSPEMDGFDPRIEEKLKTENAARYLCRLGIEGLRRMLSNNGFSANELSKAMIEEIILDNNNVLAWLEECGMDETALIGQPIADCYEKYRHWCFDTGHQPKGRSSFTKCINKRFGFASKNARVGSCGAKEQARVFARKD